MAPVGGQVQGISLDSFLQMVQMEKTTCTLRVLSDDDVGFIYINNGAMIAAEVGALSGLDAAYEIISWENSVIEIENTCDRSDNEIKQPLMNILMEGLRLRDERVATGGRAKLMDMQPTGTPRTEARQPAPPKPPKRAPHEAAPPPAPKSTAETDKPEFTFQKKKKRSVSPVRILLVVVVVIAAGAGVYLSMGISSAEKQYRALQTQLLGTPTLMEKVNLLEAYLETKPTGEYETSAKNLHTSFKRALDSEIFTALSEKASALAEAGDLKGAAAQFSKYLEDNPNTTARNRVEEEIKALTARMADQDFKALVGEAPALGPQRLDRYDAYLTEYPDSAHEAEVRALISDMGDEYYGYFETQVAIATHEEDWQRCIALVSQFTRLYPGHPRTRVMSKLIPIFETNQKQKEDFEQLMATAREKGSDYAAAGVLLSQYLKSYPNSYLRDRITSQIEHYQRLSDEVRIADLEKAAAEKVAAAGNRFRVVPDGTVLDTRTHLMWGLLDSEALLKDCIDYNGAKTFVAGLKTGGHQDWRLPSHEELEALYKEKPAFPSTSTDEKWYWSAKHYRQFVGQWISKVTVVNTAPEQSQPPLQKDSRDCGWVRAVRRP